MKRRSQAFSWGLGLQNEVIGKRVMLVRRAFMSSSKWARIVQRVEGLRHVDEVKRGTGTLKGLNVEMRREM